MKQIRQFLQILAGSILVTGALASVAAEGWKPAPVPLQTRWAKQVTPENVLPEYPRPQMVREKWQNLNGLWEFTMTRSAERPQQFGERILVPYPVESSLSGLGRKVQDQDRLWYRRSFEIPRGWKGQRVLLHFGAVDWEAVVYVNGKELGKHQGGYDPFSFDITGALTASGPQEVVVAAADPTGPYPHGKQVPNPGGIMYTSSSGIWQTVWLEPVPNTYIEKFLVVPDIDAGVVRVTVSAGAGEITAVALDGKKQVAKGQGTPGNEFTLSIPKAKLWTPDSPFLYGLKLTLTDGRNRDTVESYFGMRKISIGPDGNGITRMLLNNHFVFQVGPLDQGFWPEGLYTAPVDEALKYDIEITKRYGFNMARKHVKVEPARWYYWCDKLGLLVWQDMPSAENPNDQVKKQFELELSRMIEAFRNHPCIIVWTPFNEGWGQYDTERIVEQIKKQDPSRLVNNASGWVDKNCGDLYDQHTYPVPGTPHPEAKRAAVIGEYGGLGFPLPKHMWQKEGWGYQSFEDFNALNERYEGLCSVLRLRVKEPGISAAVYTQTSDIEVEINGLMTYDREVTKIDPAGSALALQGYSAPKSSGDAEQFIGEGSIVLESERNDAQIHYTLDGSTPTKDSPLYKGPVKVNQPVTVKARAFFPNGVASRTTEFKLTPTTALPALKVEGTEPGLKVAVYENKEPHWDKLPDFSQLTPARESFANQVNLKPAEPLKEWYGLKFQGYLTVPTTGVYVFYLAADDKGRLTIDGKPVLDVDYTQGTRRVSVGLEAGTHALQVEQYQGYGGQDLRLEYAGPGFARRPLPADALSHK